MRDFISKIWKRLFGETEKQRREREWWEARIGPTKMTLAELDAGVRRVAKIFRKATFPLADIELGLRKFGEISRKAKI